MPLRLDITRKLSNRSERVKAVDFHPSEPWLLSALYNGNVYLWNLETQTLVKTFEASDVPIRAAKFISRKSWVITGSDDLNIKVFNYNTHEKVAGFEAHSDYIRGIAIHPSQPLVLTCSDDMTIKLWDWDKNWKLVSSFEGHSHFVMHVAFNPKDSNTFCSASMDRTLKVWALSSSTANYTLEGHLKGVNCVEYYQGGDKPYLVSGADDKLIKVWDYQNKTCVQTLEGHTNNVMRVCYHPSLPIIISGSEDGTIRLWHANTYRLENTLNYGMERVSTGLINGTNDVAFGYDEGVICIKLGRDEPSVSMDNSGKIVWSKHNEIQSATIQQLDTDALVDGEKLMLSIKDLGSCEVFPQYLLHSPNGRFVVVCGDGEYIIYTALAWRNKSFGQALEFVWAQDSNEYAIRESSSKIKLFKSFKEKPNVQIKPSYACEGIFGGALLGVKSSSFISFYDWESGSIVRRVDVLATSVYWSESDMVCIACPDTFYILKFNRLAFQTHVEQGLEPSGEGYEDVLDLLVQVPECVVTGTWAGDCFMYSNSLNRLCYVVGEFPSTVSHFDKSMFVLGYIPKDNRIYVCDKHLVVSSYSVPMTVIDYQTAILRRDFGRANGLLPSIPQDQRNRMARFLEAQGLIRVSWIGLLEEALNVTTDLEHRFELSMKLSQLDVAFEIATELNHEFKWSLLGDTALHEWNYGLALECWKKADDYQSLFLMYQASGNAQGMAELGSLSEKSGEFNLSIMCYYVLGQHDRVVQILLDAARFPEAGFYARTYSPSLVQKAVTLWKQSLIKAGKPKMAESLADPKTYENLFEDYQLACEMEKIFQQLQIMGLPPSTSLQTHITFDEIDLVGDVKNGVPIQQMFMPLLKDQQRQNTNGTGANPSLNKMERSLSPVKQPPVGTYATSNRSPSPSKVTQPNLVSNPSISISRPPSPVKQPFVIANPTKAQPQLQPDLNNPSFHNPEYTSSNNETKNSPAFSAHTAPDAMSRSGSPDKSYGSADIIKPLQSLPYRSNGPAVGRSTTTKPTNAAIPDPWELKDPFPTMSDTMSHLSMEVNTTGTGSVRGIEFEDFHDGVEAVVVEDEDEVLKDEELEEMLV